MASWVGAVGLGVRGDCTEGGRADVEQLAKIEGRESGASTFCRCREGENEGMARCMREEKSKELIQ